MGNGSIGTGSTGGTGNTGSTGGTGTTGTGNTGGTDTGNTGGTESTGGTGGGTSGNGETGGTQNTGDDVRPDMPDTNAAYRKGKKITDMTSKAVYQITKAANARGSGGTVAYVNSMNWRASVIVIPKTVTLSGITYKVTAILPNTFKNNTYLKKVTIGKNVTSIGAQAFYGCKKLNTVTIGTNVQTIEQKAFCNCSSLTKIIIPSKVTVIGKQAFYKCTKLKSITINTTKLTSKSLGKNAFKGAYAKAVVKVPSESLRSYKKLLLLRGLSKKAKITAA